MPHPSIYSDYRIAKQAAGALAPACGAVLLQTPDGGKRIIHGKQVKDFKTWLAAWSYLYRIRTDQLAAEKAARQRAALDALPWAHVIEPTR